MAAFGTGHADAFAHLVGKDCLALPPACSFDVMLRCGASAAPALETRQSRFVAGGCRALPDAKTPAPASCQPPQIVTHRDHDEYRSRMSGACLVFEHRPAVLASAGSSTMPRPRR